MRARSRERNTNIKIICAALLWVISYRGHAEALESEADAMAKAVLRDHTRACDFYAVAEQRGDPLGTELLADCFFKGEGRAQDYAQSALLYERASARGVSIADCALGNQYLRGLGMPKDPTKAASLCRKSADRGAADAQTDRDNVLEWRRSATRPRTSRKDLAHIRRARQHVRAVTLGEILFYASTDGR